MVVLQMNVCLVLQLVLIVFAHICTNRMSVRAWGRGRIRGQERGAGVGSAFVAIRSASTAGISCSSSRGVAGGSSAASDSSRYFELWFKYFVLYEATFPMLVADT